MEFTKNFRAFWWAVLVFCIGYYLWGRYSKLQAGEPTWFDALAFMVWVTLAIGPFFKEMEIFGFKFKQEVEKLKEHVSSELASIRTTIQTTSDNRQTMNPQFLFSYPPPPDSQLVNIQEQIKSAIHSEMSNFGVPTVTTKAPSVETLPTDIEFLFRARLGIEKELRKIQQFVSQSTSRRPEPIFRIVDTLIRSELISGEIGQAIREVYSVCSPAIHGEDVTPAQVDFVKNTAPELISVLKSLADRYA
ncbi:MAG: hypothetical protein ACRERR_13865 [Moraxellaceae bacterium]